MYTFMMSISQESSVIEQDYISSNYLLLYIFREFKGKGRNEI